jgi:hypothetical protein
MVVTLFPW